ncbi:hypothetical protein [Jannaschia pohangensis]|uniref:Uncharacterized protein n=1 Tax=Jannaschia pohangensis TaxID=390807 RepID=A0A1I3H6S2_9RHOB|nr:hypothetical protein [Jannaschia pohangensis]SFI31414.1 hypothetical protein SAMN04488095_0473 [Jannaschia pohangensis]
MLEMLMAMIIFALAAGGIGLGLAIGRGPARTSCGATDRLVHARCADCPLRRQASERDAP